MPKDKPVVYSDSRPLYLKDFFLIKCKRCGSDNIEISAEECNTCGTIVNAECYDCHLKYNYHDFKSVSVTYIKGKEVASNIEQVIDEA